MKMLITEYHDKKYAEWMNGATIQMPVAIGFGLNDTEPSYHDTALYDEIKRVDILTHYIRQDRRIRYSGSLITTEPPVPPGETKITLKEVGLFDGKPISIANYDLEDWTAGTTSPPDNWTLTGPAGTSISREGGYSQVFGARVLGGSVTEPAYLYQEIANYVDYRGKTVTFWGAVKTDLADSGFVFIDDGVTEARSSYHAGDNTWKILKVQLAMNSAATRLRIGFGQRSSTNSADFDWANLVDQGNLWARAVFSLDKDASNPVNCIFELWLEEEMAIELIAFAKEELIADSTVRSLSPEKYQPTGEMPAVQAIISVDKAGAIRYWYEASAPTTTSGHRAAADSLFSLHGLQNIKNFKYIAESANTKLFVTYER